MTSEALATVEQSHALAVAVPESKFALLRDTYAKGASPQEFELFVAVCNRLRLDPFARQIYAVKRWNSSLRREEMTPQVSIDGMRLAAERTGKYAGQGAPEWCGTDGAWKDVWLSDEPPKAARVAVYRHGFTHPITAIALYSEYVQTTKEGNPTKFWKTMPANQLAKCAESLALRKAFPNELSGVYSVDEMQNSPEDAKPQPPKSAPPKAAKPDVPCFAVSWPNETWNGLPMSEAPFEVFDDYAKWCQSVIADPKKKAAHARAEKSLAEAEAEVERRLNAEADKVAAPHTEPANTPDDSVPQEGDRDGWGLTP